MYPICVFVYLCLSLFLCVFVSLFHCCFWILRSFVSLFLCLFVLVCLFVYLGVASYFIYVSFLISLMPCFFTSLLLVLFLYLLLCFFVSMFRRSSTYSQLNNQNKLGVRRAIPFFTSVKFLHICVWLLLPNAMSQNYHFVCLRQIYALRTRLEIKTLRASPPGHELSVQPVHNTCFVIRRWESRLSKNQNVIFGLLWSRL